MAMTKNVDLKILVENAFFSSPQSGTPATLQSPMVESWEVQKLISLDSVRLSVAFTFGVIAIWDVSEETFHHLWSTASGNKLDVVSALKNFLVGLRIKPGANEYFLFMGGPKHGETLRTNGSDSFKIASTTGVHYGPPPGKMAKPLEECQIEVYSQYTVNIKKDPSSVPYGVPNGYYAPKSLSSVFSRRVYVHSSVDVNRVGRFFEDCIEECPWITLMAQYLPFGDFPPNLFIDYMQGGFGGASHKL